MDVRQSEIPSPVPVGQTLVVQSESVEEGGNPGGLSLGRLGPVTEGMFAWIFGLGLLVGIAVWLGKKAA